MTPRLHFLEGALIHWVNEAKNMWPIDEQLPIKIKWWDAPLGLRDFSQSNKHEMLHSRSWTSAEAVNLIHTKRKNSKMKSWTNPTFFKENSSTG